MLNHSFLSKSLDKKGADYRWEVKEWSSQKVQWFCWLRCESLIFQKALSAHSMVNSNGWLQQEAPFAYTRRHHWQFVSYSLKYTTGTSIHSTHVCISLSILNSTPATGEWSASHPTHFRLGKAARCLPKTMFSGCHSQCGLRGEGTWMPNITRKSAYEIN